MQAQPAVNTSATAMPVADMFAPEEPAAASPPADVVFQFEGVLQSHATVRVRPSRKTGREVTVLCLELRVDTGRVIHAEQEFQHSAHADAERRAATLRKGTRVSLQHPIEDVRLVLPHVSSLQTIQPATAAPTQEHHQ